MYLVLLYELCTKKLTDTLSKYISLVYVDEVLKDNTSAHPIIMLHLMTLRGNILRKC